MRREGFSAITHTDKSAVSGRYHTGGETPAHVAERAALTLGRSALRLLSPEGPRGRLVILIYHRVLAERDLLLPEAPDARTFEWQMRAVSSLFTVIPLSEAVDRLKHHALPARAACVTFDDGYADNEAVALPILQRYALPATFFVAAGFLDGGCMFNDRVIEAVRHAKMPVLDLTAFGLGRHEIRSIEERRQTITSLLSQIKYRPAPERDAVAATVEAMAGVRVRTDLMMSSNQVRVLHEAGMEIGGHTVTHPVLARLDMQKAREEMALGRERLEAITGCPVRVFAYPNGKPDRDYRREHVYAARDLGFEGAVSTAWGAAGRRSDCWQLPRFTPWDRTPFRFVARLFTNYARTPAEAG